MENNEFLNKTLEKFGLTEKEIAVYLASLKQDVTAPYQLSKATGIPRTTIYDILLNLSLKGLVQLEQSDGFTKQQTKVRANNPSILRTMLQEKRRDLTRLELDIVDILPFLKEDYHKGKSNANFQFFPGVDGFRKVYHNHMDYDLDIERYTWDLLMPMDIIGHERMNLISDSMNDTQYKLKNKPKEIVALNDWTRHVISYQYGRNPLYLESREIRYLESPGFILNVELHIVGDMVRVACAEKEEIWGLSINSKALSMTLKSIFLMQWMSALPLSKELVESWGSNEMLLYEKSVKPPILT